MKIDAGLARSANFIIVSDPPDGSAVRDLILPTAMGLRKKALTATNAARSSGVSKLKAPGEAKSTLATAVLPSF